MVVRTTNTAAFGTALVGSSGIGVINALNAAAKFPPDHQYPLRERIKQELSSPLEMPSARGQLI